ncbi:MAG: aspartate kinase [Bacteroidales bacterium]
MKVFKFGGASIKDAESIKNLGDILKFHNSEELFVLVSAMGKMTNAFEDLLDSWYHRRQNTIEFFEQIISFHTNILHKLFDHNTHPVFVDIRALFDQIAHRISGKPKGSYDFEYDQLVVYGELLSSKIIGHYLNEQKINTLWVDIRDLIITGNFYREAKVNWDKSAERLKGFYKGLTLNKKEHLPILLGQGFIGKTENDHSTTLGREGSDFSGAIIAHILETESLTIWKDVEGLLNADPKKSKDTSKLDNISYGEAIELAYYGATVIHPKTIKPLENKNIPLYVKSFNSPLEKGTLINKNKSKDKEIPSYIYKEDQILISVSPKDFSFIAENNLYSIFGLISDLRIKINMMQNSALSFSIVTDYIPSKVNSLVSELSKSYKVTHNKDLQLVTIRHYNSDILDSIISDSELCLEQKSRDTIQLVLKSTSSQGS